MELEASNAFKQFEGAHFTKLKWVLLFVQIERMGSRKRKRNNRNGHASFFYKKGSPIIAATIYINWTYHFPTNDLY